LRYFIALFICAGRLVPRGEICLRGKNIMQGCVPDLIAQHAIAETPIRCCRLGAATFCRFCCAPWDNRDYEKRYLP